MNLWPFVGVLLVLLFVFMVSVGSLYNHHGMFVDLPMAASATFQPKALREDAMKVWLTRDGRVFFRKYYVSAGDLPRLIHEAVQQGAERKVYLAADSRARYSDAAAVVEQISKAGIREMCILANKRER